MINYKDSFFCYSIYLYLVLRKFIKIIKILALLNIMCWTKSEKLSKSKDILIVLTLLVTDPA